MTWLSIYCYISTHLFQKTHLKQNLPWNSHSVAGTTLKINMEHNHGHGGLVQIISSSRIISKSWRLSAVQDTTFPQEVLVRHHPPSWALGLTMGPPWWFLKEQLLQWKKHRVNTTRYNKQKTTIPLKAKTVRWHDLHKHHLRNGWHFGLVNLRLPNDWKCFHPTSTWDALGSPRIPYIPPETDQPNNTPRNVSMKWSEIPGPLPASWPFPQHPCTSK